MPEEQRLNMGLLSELEMWLAQLLQQTLKLHYSAEQQASCFKPQRQPAWLKQLAVLLVPQLLARIM
ncbi:MAG: hypothetical protein EBR82_46765 [Caulobacteraceae bacterium]|nr:hypothetical protein [Caulobacteraceae bacterium]